MMLSTEVQTPRMMRARETDVATVMALRAGLTRHGVGPLAIPSEPDAAAALLRDPAVILVVAQLGEQPVGLAYLVREMDGRVRLATLGVLPEHRRQGIGASLLTHGLIAALPATAIYAYLGADDPAALAWARDRAFRPVDPTQSHAPDGSLEVELRLDAPAPSAQGGCACGGTSCGCGHH